MSLFPSKSDTTPTDATKTINRVRIVFDNPSTQINDIVGVGKYGTTGRPFAQALQEGREMAVAVINAAYDFVDEPLQPEMMQGIEAYFDSEKTTICMVVRPETTQKDGVKRRLQESNPQTQHSNDEVMQMLATLQTEFSQLKSDLTRSIQNLEKARAGDQAVIAKLEAKNIQLEEVVTRLKEERAGDQVVIAKLEAKNIQLEEVITGLEAKNTQLEEVVTRLEGHCARSQDEITALKEQLKVAIGDLCKSTSVLIRLRLRILLDLARKKVIQLLGIESWDDLQVSQPASQLAHHIKDELTWHKIPCTLSVDALTYICSYNNVRREGNKAAHRACRAEIREAIMGSPMDHDRHLLEEVYRFKFEESVYDDIQNDQLTI